MINFPAVFQRNFKNDFSPLDPTRRGKFVEQAKRVALAVLPLFSLHKSCRGPLSLAMSGVRTVTHLSQMTEACSQREIKKFSFHFLHVALSTASVCLFFFNPVYCFLSSSVSDLLIAAQTCVQALQEGDHKKALKSLFHVSLNLLFLAAICYGAIEITVACMLVQIALDLYDSAKHFKVGNYLEGGCQLLLGAGRLYQLTPQLKLLHWKMVHNPTLTGELKQAKNGFVYLDIPDEQLHSLFELYKSQGMELPPYFGKGMAGAHISAILSEEMAKSGITINDIGKKFTFRIANVDSVQPDGWKGVNKVHFLTLSCPELESMRMRNGFSPKIQDHDFHLTFAIERA